jgi:hypothetical protein
VRRTEVRLLIGQDPFETRECEMPFWVGNGQAQNSGGGGEVLVAAGAAAVVLLLHVLD